jgi:hypothetical protein
VKHVARRARPLVAYPDGPDVAASAPSHFGGEPCDVFLGWMPVHRDWLDGPLTGWTHMAGYALRNVVLDGRVHYVPTRLSGVPALLAALQPDVVVVPGVRRGHEFAYAASIGWAPAAVAAGAQLVVEIDDDADDVGAPLIEGAVHAPSARAARVPIRSSWNPRTPTAASRSSSSTSSPATPPCSSASAGWPTRSCVPSTGPYAYGRAS